MGHLARKQTLPFKVTVENKLRCFQLKIIHNILPSNSSLFKMKLRSSSSCDCCNHPHEALSHLLYECPIVQTFWQKVTAFWNEKRSESVKLNVTHIIYGYKPESRLFFALNHFLLIVKHHIFQCWLNNVSPCLEICRLILNDKIFCERTIAVKNNSLTKFTGIEVGCTVCVIKLPPN